MDGNLSHPVAAEPRRWPEGQLSPRAGPMSPSQSAITQLGWGFHTLRGGIDPRNLRFRPRVVGVVEIWKDFQPGDGNLSSPGCAGSMYDLQLITDRPVGLGFPHRAGRFRPGVSPFSPPGYWICRCMDRFLIREWGPNVPGWRWLYSRAPANR